jgi:hypothetical protein
MFSSSEVTSPRETIPKLSFKVIWNFPNKNKRVLVLLPYLLIEDYHLLKQNPILMKNFLNTIQSISGGEQQHIVITFPWYYEEFNVYDLEELLELEVRPLDSLETLNDPEFKPTLQSNILYYLPFDEEWFQPTLLMDYFDHVVREEYTEWEDWEDLDLVDGNQVVCEKINRVRLQQTMIFTEIPVLKMGDLDLVIVLGYMGETFWFKNILHTLMKKETILTLYLCDSNLDDLYDFALDNDPRVPNVYFKTALSKNSLRIMWETFEKYNQSHTFFIFLGEFDLCSESRFLWHELAKSHFHHSIYDMYAYHSLDLQRLKNNEIQTTLFPSWLLESN